MADDSSNAEVVQTFLTLVIVLVVIAEKRKCIKNAKKALKLSQVTSIKNCHTHTDKHIHKQMFNNTKQNSN